MASPNEAPYDMIHSSTTYFSVRWLSEHNEQQQRHNCHTVEDIVNRGICYDCTDRSSKARQIRLKCKAIVGSLASGKSCVEDCWEHKPRNASGVYGKAPSWIYQRGVRHSRVCAHTRRCICIDTEEGWQEGFKKKHRQIKKSHNEYWMMPKGKGSISGCQKECGIRRNCKNSVFHAVLCGFQSANLVLVVRGAAPGPRAGVGFFTHYGKH